MRFPIFIGLISVACKQDIAVRDEANVPPAVVINAPDDQSVFSDLDTIEFIGTVADANGPEDLASILWTSSLDGEFEGEPRDNSGLVRAPVRLSVGVHTVTLRAADDEGLTATDAITVVVEDSAQNPLAAIIAPETLDSYVLGTEVALEGMVSDPQQDSDTLLVRWEAMRQGAPAGSEVVVFEGAPGASGVTNAIWSSVDALGQWRIILSVEDDQAHVTEVEVLVVVVDSLDADLDGDGWSPNQGDCDDNDPTRHPNAVEICANSIDEDCNGIVDDKDEDVDGHVDIECDPTYVGPFPSDDCDDSSAAVYPGAPEVIDGLDNNCDGQADEGTNAWDADGDCSCVGVTCTGSVNATCVNLVGGDCDDANPNNAPNLVEVCDGADNDCDFVADNGLPGTNYYPDADGDSYGNQMALAVVACGVPPAQHVPNNGDCNDGNPVVNPAAIELSCDGVDNDCDLGTPDGPDGDGDGSSVCLDCDDADPLNFPGNNEACDGADNDCDGLIDDGVMFAAYWPDTDGDGYGELNGMETLSCSGAPSGFTDEHTDCDDTEPLVNPGLAEITCDGLENDCDLGTPDQPDGDNDGVSVCTDCDDTDPLNFPGNTEFCDGADNNCNNVVDDNVMFTDFWPDLDGDNRGDESEAPTNACIAPPNMVNNDLDCDDADPDNYGDNIEVCDGADNDCDTVADNGLAFADWYPDLDGDTYGGSTATPLSTCDGPPAGNYIDRGGDCNDIDPLINPLAPEIQCDGVDNDCLAQTEDAPDQDVDGVDMCMDCDDGDPNNYQGNPEVCDGADNDCDSVADNGLTFTDHYFDLDGDGFGNVASPATSTCNGAPADMVADNTDCNDSDNFINPAAAEVSCDLADNDCNPSTPDQPDADGDGVSACFDCDDGDINNFPGNFEVCDGADNNCNLTIDDGLAFVEYWLDDDMDDHGDATDPSVTLCSGAPLGYVDSNDDCDDTDGNNFPGNPEVCDGFDNDCLDGADDGLTFTDYWPDSDNDSFGSDAVGPTSTCDDAPNPSGWATNNTDCDDASGTVNPSGTELVADGIDQDCNGGDDCYTDADGDGVGINSVFAGATLGCTDPGESDRDDDCSDNVAVDPDAALRFPGNPEQCDGIDNDCNTLVDDGTIQFFDFYADTDGDGYGDSGDAPENACQAPPNTVTDNTDCDDADTSVNPGQSETTCNSKDDDCSAATEDAPDGDGDGDPVCTDCDDTDPVNASTLPEICDGFDNNCNVTVDDGLAFVDYWPDQDDDSYGSPVLPLQNTCSGAPGGYVSNNDDCDDFDGALNQDDIDGDGVSTCDADCDDDAPGTYPNAPDVPDENFTDEDCDGIDGVEADAVFVSTSGSDTSLLCLKSTPCRSVNHAMDRASVLGLTEVYVRTGTYFGGMEMLDGMNIYGGFDTSWVRDANTISAHNVTIRGGYEAAVTEYITVWASDLIGVAGLYDLEIDGPAAFGSEGGGNGRSSYAIYADDSDLDMARLVINQGNGANGLSGSSGGSASSSAPGSAEGGDGGDPVYHLFCSTARESGGSGGTNGSCSSTTGGNGGSSGQSDHSCPFLGFGDPTAGFNGGSGNQSITNGAGYRGAGGVVCENNCNADNGGDGNDGRITNGSSGNGSDNDGWLQSGFWYGLPGLSGGNGTHGGGGGGGGGGAGEDNGASDNDSGGGGGGGGAGGCRAIGGTAGGSGGSSWGVFSYRSAITIADSQIYRGTGGAGRNGGNGGNGQPGGVAGLGGANNWDSGDGGDGGNGGHGGHGGGGGAGSGGNAYGFFTYQGSISRPGTSVSGGSVGAAGSGGDSAPLWADGNDGGNGQSGASGTTFICSSAFGC